MKQAYYFSHDSNAKDDPKCMLLIDQLGLEGYGIFWVLVETLREQPPKYRYPLQLIPILARRYNTTSEKMMTVVKQYGFFEITSDEFFFSPSLVERMKQMKKVIDAKRRGGLNSAKARRQRNAELSSNTPTTLLQQRKERKGKEKKGNEKEDEITKRRLQFVNKVNSLSTLFGSEQMKLDFIDYWVEKNERGRKMRFEKEKTFDLKRRIATWIRNDKKFNSNGRNESFTEKAQRLVSNFD